MARPATAGLKTFDSSNRLDMCLAIVCVEKPRVAHRLTFVASNTKTTNRQNRYCREKRLHIFPIRLSNTRRWKDDHDWIVVGSFHTERCWLCRAVRSHNYSITRDTGVAPVQAVKAIMV